MNNYIEPDNDFSSLIERSLIVPENIVSPHKNLLAESITLAGLGLMVIQGVLQKLGAKIFDSIFDTDVNVKELLKETVRQIETVVREALSGEAIRQCEARIDALTSLMRAYKNAPDTSLDRLEHATSESNGLTSECKSLGFKAVLPYCTAASLEIAVLQERLARFNDPGERTTIIQLCEESYYATSKAIQDCRLWSYARFSDLEYGHIWEGDVGQDGWYYTFNGEQVYLGQGHETKDYVVRKREEHMLDEQFKLEKGLACIPALDIAIDMWKIAKMYKEQQLSQ